MSAKIYVHPSVGLVAFSEFCATAGLEVDFVLWPHGAIACRPVNPTPRPCFRCRGCGWAGETPLWMDSRDTFLPPRGEIPMCPRCAHHPVIFG